MRFGPRVHSPAGLGRARAPILTAAVGLLLAACSGSPASHAHTPPPRVSSGPSATPSPAQGSGPTGPASFQPFSFTAVSPADYWLLGSKPCATGRCLAIRATTNGGTTFSPVTAPPLPATNSSGISPTLRFVDQLDGFAFITGTGGAFYATQNGGQSWLPVALGDVVAFASGAGEVYVVISQPSPGGGATYRFGRSPASSNSWQTSPIPFGQASVIADLEAHGSDVWLLGTAAVASPSMNDALARSTNYGASFVTGPGPCIPELGGTLAPDSPSVVWAVCPTGMAAGAWRSTDGGVSFSLLPTGELPNSAQLAPASDTAAVLAPNNGTSGLLRSTNGGMTWAEAATPSTGNPVMFLGFTNPEVGVALVSIDQDTQWQLWWTTDAGANWYAVSLG